MDNSTDTVHARNDSWSLSNASLDSIDLPIASFLLFTSGLTAIAVTKVQEASRLLKTQIVLVPSMHRSAPANTSRMGMQQDQQMTKTKQRSGPSSLDQPHC